MDNTLLAILVLLVLIGLCIVYYYLSLILINTREIEKLSWNLKDICIKILSKIK